MAATIGIVLTPPNKDSEILWTCVSFYRIFAAWTWHPIDSFADALMAGAAVVAGIIFWFTFRHLEQDEKMDFESRDVRHTSTGASSAVQEDFSDSDSLGKTNTHPLKKEV